LALNSAHFSLTSTINKYGILNQSIYTSTNQVLNYAYTSDVEGVETVVSRMFFLTGEAESIIQLYFQYAKRSFFAVSNLKS
jgi:hypothetical protein